MKYFCTYFDRNYLSRGLALHHSLKEHCPEFRLWALCMDESAYKALKQLNLPEIEPIALHQFEQGDDSLLRAKQNRSKVEYYFTCTPSLPLYVLNHWPEVDLITYLDSDLFFFANPEPLFKEMGANSISIIDHRFPPRLRNRARFGIYNVAWLSFRRDENGLDCLNWWREQCIAWCYDREEKGRFADQKYLDDWPVRFQNVTVLQHKGANLAPWNQENYRISFQDGHCLVDDEPLIFYHFQGFREVRRGIYDAGLWSYHVRAPSQLITGLYFPYVKAFRLPLPEISMQSSRYSVLREAKFIAGLIMLHLNRGMLTESYSYVLDNNCRILV